MDADKMSGEESDEPQEPTCFVVDSGRTRKVGYYVENRLIVQMMAGFSFSGAIPDPRDEMVVEKNGEPLNTDRQFVKYDHFMYLKAGEKWTKNTGAPVENMDYEPYKPLDPPKSTRVDVSPTVLDVYWVLAKDDNWRLKEAWERFSKEQLNRLVDVRVQSVMDHFENKVEDDGVFLDIWCEAVNKRKKLMEDEDDDW